MMIGRKTMFMRTAGCDYSCSWCDSAFTWDGTEKPIMYSPDKAFEEIYKIGGGGFDHVTITGGNPALIGQGMSELIDILHSKGISMGIETQGTKYQDWFSKSDDIVISPKPPSSGMVTDYTKLDFIINNIQSNKQNKSLKVVIFNEEDYQYAKNLHFRYPNIEFYLSVGNLTPYSEEDHTAELLRDLEKLCNKVINDPSLKSVKVLPQLHTLLWGNKRKV